MARRPASLYALPVLVVPVRSGKKGALEIMRQFSVFAVAALAACGAVQTADDAPQPIVEADPPAAIETQSAPDSALMPIADWMDCLREEGGLAIAAHRGGPGPGYPENALETMQRGLDAGLTVFEVDVAESRDGVLFLLHDRTLGRTTTGDGPVVDTDWETIAALRLQDRAGTVSDFSPPKLSDVLLWAVENDAIVELDRKSSTSFRNIVTAVRAAGAENHTILITYNDREAGEVARLAPDMVMTASAYGARDIARLAQSGVKPENLIAWTGTSDPDPAAFERLRAEGVEPAFGTLGRPGQRLDDEWLADGDASEFQDLVDAGVVLLATDAPLEVAAALDADDVAASACPR